MNNRDLMTVLAIGILIWALVWAALSWAGLA